jgi:beta-lactamase regulating signal transducer with metallopeptidase domain
MNPGLLTTLICCVAIYVNTAAADAVAAADYARSTIRVSDNRGIGYVAPVLAQVTKDPLGLSPEDRKRYDELMRSADTDLRVAYIAAGLGIACIVVGIALMIYRDY